MLKAIKWAYRQGQRVTAKQIIADLHRSIPKQQNGHAGSREEILEFEIAERMKWMTERVIGKIEDEYLTKEKDL